jgi:hypothetical protein
VNTLPLSVRICCGTPCRRIAALTQNREWSSGPVSAFAVDPSASPIPPTTSIGHSSIGAPRSQRFHDARRRRAPGSINPARVSPR